MNTIQSVFTERGFDHLEIERKGEWRLFERSKNGRVHWEVVRIKVKPALELFGKLVEEREVYPPSESWGIDGFTLNSLDSARRKLSEVGNPPNREKLPAIPIRE